MAGVAQWTYVDEESDIQSGSEDDVDEQEVEEKPATPPPVNEEPEPEPMDEDTPEAEEEEVEPTPPRSNGRRAKAARHSAPAAKASTRVAKQKPKSHLAAKPQSPTMPKTRAKKPLVSRPKGKDVKGKGKGKSKASDIYDFDDE